jgi:hypothetical protein
MRACREAPLGRAQDPRALLVGRLDGEGPAGSTILRSPIATDWSGAAAFGATGAAAVTGEMVEVVCTPPRRIETFEPERARAGAYAERLPNWRKFYRPRR